MKGATYITRILQLFNFIPYFALVVSKVWRKYIEQTCTPLLKDISNGFITESFIMSLSVFLGFFTRCTACSMRDELIKESQFRFERLIKHFLAGFPQLV
jgi:uncharacterized membrane protein YfhO